MSGITQFEYNRLGQVFTAANQAAATVTLINTSTATGFILSNPWGSGKNLAILSAGFQYTTVPAATAIVWLAMSIAPNPTAHASVTALNVYAADGSGNASGRSVARAYSASTTPNLPVYTRSLGYSPTTPATAGDLVVRDNIEGSLILVPGSYLQVSYIGAAPVGMTDMTWMEYVAP
jgi:hypothetical protein